MEDDLKKKGGGNGRRPQKKLKNGRGPKKKNLKKTSD
jgi:hypothetical protein